MGSKEIEYFIVVSFQNSTSCKCLLLHLKKMSENKENQSGNDAKLSSTELNYLTYNEILDIAMNAESYELPNVGEHEEDEDDNIDLEENLEIPQLNKRENNAGDEEDENVLLINDKDDQVEFPDENVVLINGKDDQVEFPEDNPDESVDDLTNFFNKVPELESVLRGAIKRCRTGLPEANQEDKSDLFHKYKGRPYVFLTAVKFLHTKFQLRDRPTSALLKIVNHLWDSRIPTDVRYITRPSFEVEQHEVDDSQ